MSKAYKDHYGVATLVSGDGDFARAVKEVKDTGKKVEVAYFPRCYHLQVAADRFIRLSGEVLSDCWIRKK